MAKIGISIYSIRISQFRGEDAELHNLHEGKGLIDIAKDFIVNHMKSYTDKSEDENIFTFVDWSILQINDSEGNGLFSLLYGKLKSGAYGIEAEIVDKDSGITTHNVKTTEARVLPFNFCIAVGAGTGDKGTTNAVAIFQTISGDGVKTLFSDSFNSYLKRVNASLNLSFGALYPKEFIKSYLREGKLTRINMIQYRIPDDIAERIGVNKGVKKSKQILSIVNPIGFIERKRLQLEECLQGQCSYTKIIELPDFDYDDLRLVFRIGENNKTISMKNLDKVVLTEDITDEVALDGGNPTKESIIGIFVNYAREYLNDMGLIMIAEDADYVTVVVDSFIKEES